MSNKPESTSVALAIDGQPAATNALAVRLADLPIQQRTDLVISALLRYREGEHIFQIARDLGVSRAGLYRHILAIAPDQWKEAKVARALDLSLIHI